MSKSGFAAIIGRPNVGKSTLLNSILGQKISITSNKPQTTRENIRGIFTDDRGQIIFIDTPGANRPKNKLGSFMESEIASTREDADVILFLVEPDKVPGPGDKRIAKTIAESKAPIYLIINKIDTLSVGEVLPVIDSFKNLLDFKEIFPVSAKTGEGIDKLLDTVFNDLPKGPSYYGEDEVTDMPIRAMCAELIREKGLLLLSEELPHGIAVVIDSIEPNKSKNLYHIMATIVCEKASHKSMIIGSQGKMLKKIGTLARRDMEDLLEKKVNLKLWVQVRKNWRDSDRLLKNYGYRRDI